VWQLVFVQILSPDCIVHFSFQVNTFSKLSSVIKWSKTLTPNEGNKYAYFELFWRTIQQDVSK
jgi:hypothetical protein